MVLKMRAERLSRGWSMTDVCMKTRIAPSDLSLIERGLIPAYPGWRKRLIKAFGLSEDELFEPEEDGGNGK